MPRRRLVCNEPPPQPGRRAPTPPPYAGPERRQAIDPAYKGPERRVANRPPPERREPVPRSILGLVFLVVALLADNALDAGYYRRWLVDEVHGAEHVVRGWSDRQWSWTAAPGSA